MEPSPASSTRPLTAANCRKETWKQSGLCLLGLSCAAFPIHYPFAPHWAVSLYFLAITYSNAKSAIHWFLLTRYMGRTVTWRVGPHGHTWWQRTVTYSVPQALAKPKDPPPASAIITLGWTLVTGIMLLFTVSAFANSIPISIWTRLAYVAVDIPLTLYTAHNWKRVRQDKQRRALARARDTAP